VRAVTGRSWPPAAPWMEIVGELTLSTRWRLSRPAAMRRLRICASKFPQLDQSLPTTGYTTPLFYSESLFTYTPD
jgi:hypothetical protein